MPGDCPATARFCPGSECTIQNAQCAKRTRAVRRDGEERQHANAMRRENGGERQNGDKKQRQPANGIRSEAETQKTAHGHGLRKMRPPYKGWTQMGESINSVRREGRGRPKAMRGKELGGEKIYLFCVFYPQSDKRGGIRRLRYMICTATKVTGRSAIGFLTLP